MYSGFVEKNQSITEYLPLFEINVLPTAVPTLFAPSPYSHVF